MVEIAIMLLPIAAASGWYFASRHYKSASKASNKDHAGYFKGLNYLLNEQPDKAIDVFVDLLEIDDEVIEIHLALGTLFRQRGEVERSIRLHQNLIARPLMTHHTRLDVLNELGLDYMRAGLLDRAESIFTELEKEITHKTNAIKQLLLIYQQEKEWQKLIDYSIKLESIENKKTPILLSHFHCEIAAAFIAKHDIKGAERLLKKALKIDPMCVRANVMSAQAQIKNADYKRALKSLLSIKDQDIRFIPIFIDLVIECFDELEKPKQKFKLLSELQSQIDSTIVFSRFNDALTAQKGSKHALAFMRERLLNEPKISHLSLYAKLETDSQIDGEAKFFRDAIKQLDEIPLSFQCNHCGFSSLELNWCCPTCKEWGAVTPKVY